MTIHPLQEMTDTDYQTVVWIGSSAPLRPSLSYSHHGGFQRREDFCREHARSTARSIEGA